MKIKPTPESVYSQYEYYDYLLYRDKTIGLFPLSDGILQYYEYIRSPVVTIDTEHEGEYYTPSILTLKTDVVLNSNTEFDYCLGKASETTN